MYDFEVTYTLATENHQRVHSEIMSISHIKDPKIAKNCFTFMYKEERQIQSVTRIA